jgi:hypothetical protein
MPALVANRPARAIGIILALCVTAGLPAWFATEPDRGQQGRRPVAQPVVVDAPPAAADLAEMLAQSRSAAEGRNHAALALCTAEITAVLERQFTDLYFRAEPIAAEIATYNNCIKLVAMLASDQVRGRSDARDWVQERIEARINPQITTCQQEIQAAIERLDRELTASTLTMASELAAIGGSGSVLAAPHYAEGLAGLSLDAALGKLGFRGALVPPAVVLDIYALMHTRIGSWLVAKVVEMVKWIFARPLAAAVTEAGLVVVDGPLPIGDAFAALGAAWTAYDIYALRNHFETELRSAIRDSLPEARRSLERRIWATLRERVASHAKLQTRMHDETAREILR